MSEQAQYTSGLWRARTDDTCTIRDEADNQIAMFTYMRTRQGGRRSATEVARNTILAAAAPELLEALEFLLLDTQHAEHDCGDTTETCPVLRARAAIAKAKGQS